MVEIDEGLTWPELPLQLLASHNFPWPIKKDAEDKKGLPLQPATPSIPSQLPRREVEFEAGKLRFDCFLTRNHHGISLLTPS
jgi:hypothetical protein